MNKFPVVRGAISLAIACIIFVLAIVAIAFQSLKPVPPMLFLCFIDALIAGSILAQVEGEVTKLKN